MIVRNNLFVFLLSLLTLLLSIMLTGCEQITLEETETALNSACETFDAQSAADAVKVYCDTHEDISQLESILFEKAESLCADGDYKNFELMDAMVEQLAEYPIQEGLQRILDDNDIIRAKSFLAGTWVRCDGTKLDGCEITIKTSDTAILGIITNASGIKDAALRTSFKANDIKWNKVNIVDRTLFTFEDLSKNDTGYYDYSSSSGEIDYTYSMIYVHVTGGNTDEYEKGNDQVWVKKNYIDLYSTVDALSEEDNYFSALDFENSENVESINCADLPSSSMGCFYYNPDVDRQEAILDIISTARDVHITTPKQEVIEKYGIGDFRAFNKEADELYKFLTYCKDPGLDLLDEQCVSSVSYTSEYITLTFYFDREDTVSWVTFSRL